MIAPLAALLIAASAPSGITEVVVYPDRARVTRKQSVPCGRATTVQFDALPPAADVGSLRAAVAGGELRGLWTEERARDKAFSSELQAVRDQIRRVGDERVLTADLRQAQLDAAQLAEAYLKSAAGGIGRELENPPKVLANWQKAFLSPLQRETDALSAAAELQAKLRELDRQLAVLGDQANRLTAAGARKERVAQVLLSCPARSYPDDDRADVFLSYIVGGASWQPVYEARGSPEAEDVEFSTYATVKQATGEDWSGVQLLLSTAAPYSNATPPEIAPLVLSAFEREPPKKVLVSNSEDASHAELAGSSAPQPASGFVGRDQGLSVQLEVPGTSDVVGNGTAVRLKVGKQKFSARFVERVAPALLPLVFRVADVTNSGGTPLLAGNVEVFWKGAFVGRQPLERVAAGGLFHLTLGIDERIKVEREVLEEVKRDTGLFGKSHRLRYGYRLKITNHMRENAKLELAEQLPVSELDDVTVAVDPQTTPGFERHNQDGRLVWQLTLPPANPLTIELHFHVDVPADYDIGGL